MPWSWAEQGAEQRPGIPNRASSLRALTISPQPASRWRASVSRDRPRSAESFERVLTERVVYGEVYHFSATLSSASDGKLGAARPRVAEPRARLYRISTTSRKQNSLFPTKSNRQFGSRVVPQHCRRPGSHVGPLSKGAASKPGDIVAADSILLADVPGHARVQ